jgi:hypothetical protein
MCPVQSHLCLGPLSGDGTFSREDFTYDRATLVGQGTRLPWLKVAAYAPGFAAAH